MPRSKLAEDQAWADADEALREDERDHQRELEDEDDRQRAQEPTTEEKR